MMGFMRKGVYSSLPGFREREVCDGLVLDDEPVLDAVQVLIAFAEKTSDRAEAGDIFIAEAVCVVDALVHGVCDVDEVA